MLRALLVGADLSMIRDYVSPVFFEVIPARSLSTEIRALAGGRLQAPTQQRRALAASLPPGVVLGDAGSLPTSEAGRRRHGQRVLQLYFQQIYTQPSAFLDLRPERFAADMTQSVWSPGWLQTTWSPEFITSIRNLYRGFYGEDSPLFEHALSELSLTAARKTFVSHFGGGDQRAVRFERAHFHQTFHQVFQSCAQEGSSLHANFVSLGLMLGCLYAHLEQLDLEFDVRAAHDRALVLSHPSAAEC